MDWNKIKQNIKHLPSTLIGLCLVLSTMPQLDAVQKVMALSPRIANFITITACIAGGLSAILFLGQKVFKTDKKD
jgi:hypothetical protein